MIDADKKAFAELMIGIGEMYNKEVSKSLMSLYFNSLKGLNIDDVKDGVNSHITDSKYGSFFPKPADILRKSQSRATSIQDRALLAWSEVSNAIIRTGSYGSPEFSDPITNAAIRQLGSWIDLCKTESDKMTWKQKEFIEMFCLFENTPLEALPEHVKGRIDLQYKSLENTGGIIGKIKDWRERSKPQLVGFVEGLNADTIQKTANKDGL